MLGIPHHGMVLESSVFRMGSFSEANDEVLDGLGATRRQSPTNDLPRRLRGELDQFQPKGQH
jgi:hypothetical protein